MRRTDYLVAVEAHIAESGRHMHEHVEVDLQYIDRWSLWLDFVILLRTPLALVRTPGA